VKGLPQQQLLFAIHLHEPLRLKELFHVPMMEALGELIDPVETSG
jgi:hypothetical protein